MSGQFAKLKGRGPVAVDSPAPSAERPASGRTKPSRDGKKAISGYFDPDLSTALQILALERKVSLQDLMGEAFDDVLRKYGKHPVGSP